jgi:excisionase family DNA binding protein
MSANIQTDALAVGVAEAARLLNVSGRFIFILIKRGEIPSLRIGTRRLIRVEALRAYLKKQEKAGQ